MTVARHALPLGGASASSADVFAGIALDGDGPLFMQLKRAFARAILSGAFPIGGRLPSEEAIAGHWQLSRQTVHKAVALLAREGLVRRRRRAGTFVAAGQPDSFILPIEDISDFVAARGGLYEYRVVARSVVANGRNGTFWPDVAEGTPLLSLDSLHLCDGTPIQTEHRLVNLEVVPEAGAESFDQMPCGLWLLRHVPWSSAEHRVRAVNATTEVAALLAVEPGTACLVVERRTVHLGKPVTIVLLTSVGNRFSLVGSSMTTTASELNKAQVPSAGDRAGSPLSQGEL